MLAIFAWIGALPSKCHRRLIDYSLFQKAAGRAAGLCVMHRVWLDSAVGHKNNTGVVGSAPKLQQSAHDITGHFTSVILICPYSAVALMRRRRQESSWSREWTPS